MQLSFGTRFADFSTEFFTVRGAVFLLGKVAAVAGAYFALQAGDALWLGERIAPKPVSLDDIQEPTGPKVTAPLETYQIITKRNLFGATDVQPQAQVPVANVQKPKLRLVGVSIGSKGEKIAIVEDLNKNEQDVFELNQQVFSFGKLIDIGPEAVKLQYSDRVDTLEIEEGSGGGASPASGSSESSSEETEFSVPEAELSDALANLPLLLSQARAVPYFRNGQSIGMRLFAIRSGSLYEKLGLKNGDIITAVNDSSLSDPAQALKLFEQLKSERSITVKAERNGEQKTLQYSIR